MRCRRSRWIADAPSRARWMRSRCLRKLCDLAEQLLLSPHSVWAAQRSTDENRRHSTRMDFVRNWNPPIWLLSSTVKSMCALGRALTDMNKNFRTFSCFVFHSLSYFLYALNFLFLFIVPRAHTLSFFANPKPRWKHLSQFRHFHRIHCFICTLNTYIAEHETKLFHSYFVCFSSHFFPYIFRCFFLSCTAPTQSDHFRQCCVAFHVCKTAPLNETLAACVSARGRKTGYPLRMTANNDRRIIHRLEEEKEQEFSVVCYKRPAKQLSDIHTIERATSRWETFFSHFPFFSSFIYTHEWERNRGRIA